MTKLVAFFVAVGAALLVVGGVASATEGISTDPDSVAPGGTFEVTVFRNSPCGVVEIGIVGGSTLGTIPEGAFIQDPLDQQGEVGKGTFTAPNQPGSYTIYAEDGECLRVTTTLDVDLPASTTTAATTTTTTAATTTTTTTTTTAAPTTTAAAAVPPAPTTTAAPATLPATGRASRNVLLLAGFLTLAGGALVMARRNPRQA